jgi:hypothetical protein
MKRGLLGHVVMAALLLAGCATPHPITSYANRVNEQKVCCTSFREMNFGKLTVGEKRDLSIDSDSPVFMFKDGRSRFAALQLPALTIPAKLRLETHVVPLWIEPTVFDPFITFLGKDYETMGEAVPTLRFKSDFFAGRYWESEIPVPPGAAYAVVYTKPVLYLTFMYYNPEKSLTFVPGKVPLVIPTQAVPIMAGPHGKLSLEIVAAP